MEQLKRLWQRGRSVLMITSGFFPIALLLMANFAPQLLNLVWVWPLAHLLLNVSGTYVKGKLRILYVFFQLAVLLIIAASMSIAGGNLWIFSLPVLYAVLLLIDMPRNAEKRGEQTYLLLFALAGVLAHILGQLFLAHNRRIGNPILEPVAPWMTFGFFFFIFLTLILLNGSNLMMLSHRRFHVSSSIRQKNWLMTLVIAGVSAIVALVPGLISGLKKLFVWIPKVLQWLMELLQRLRTDDSPGSIEGNATGEMDILPTDNSSSMPQWLEKVISVLGLLLVIGFLLFCLYHLGRKLMVLLRQIRKQFGKYFHAVSEDYIDEITDTRDSQNFAARGKKEKRLSSFDVRKLTPSEQIRYRYRLLLRRHSSWTRGSTARENLGRDTAVIYEAVRYGGQEATEADSKRFEAETKKI